MGRLAAAKAWRCPRLPPESADQSRNASCLAGAGSMGWFRVGVERATSGKETLEMGSITSFFSHLHNPAGSFGASERPIGAGGQVRVPAIYRWRLG
jgi:hypothetical protein